MSARQLWVLSLKAKVLENCELDNDGSEFQYVESFLFTDDSNKLLAQTNVALGQMRLELDKTFKLTVYKPEDWSRSDDPMCVELLHEAAEQAIATKELTLGAFTSSKIKNKN